MSDISMQDQFSVHYGFNDKAQPEEEPLIKVVPRAEWGAMPPKTTSSLTLPLTHVRYNQTHTDFCLTREECAGVLQKIQKEHMETKGMSDIQYHFMIGGDGVVYEGRGWNNKGENHPGIKEKEYYDVAYIGNYPKYQVPVKVILSLYDLLEIIEIKELVTTPYVLFNDPKDLEKTPDDIQTHEVYGHIDDWRLYRENEPPIAHVRKTKEEIAWTKEERELGYDKNEVKLTPEEVEYLFANKKWCTPEENRARIDEIIERNRSFYEPHYADVILQEAKDEYEKRHGVKYDEDFSERAMTPLRPPTPPRVYQDPMDAHGEESIITRLENIMRPQEHRFDKYGKEIPKEEDKEKDDVQSEELSKPVKRGRGRPKTSTEGTQSTNIDGGSSAPKPASKKYWFLKKRGSQKKDTETKTESENNPKRTYNEDRYDVNAPNSLDSDKNTEPKSMASSLPGHIPKEEHKEKDYVQSEELSKPVKRGRGRPKTSTEGTQSTNIDNDSSATKPATKMYWYLKKRGSQTKDTETKTESENNPKRTYNEYRYDGNVPNSLDSYTNTEPKSMASSLPGQEEFKQNNFLRTYPTQVKDVNYKGSKRIQSTSGNSEAYQNKKTMARKRHVKASNLQQDKKSKVINNNPLPQQNKYFTKEHGKGNIPKYKRNRPEDFLSNSAKKRMQFMSEIQNKFKKT